MGSGFYQGRLMHVLPPVAPAAARACPPHGGRVPHPPGQLLTARPRRRGSFEGLI
ncbi:hypothetical protein METH_19035 [Leisingera methylohalidivorans DSM 14336]|uniref:Uncharacterized protein n=1 Tax=Leisingera methylohalidivorans DSM 14336 TaxID=999552 RepID=V9W0X3_9RHOB|nr:hypothetical protein METH_19035 [Leisingera methylohalidivorans DSM 14336]